MKKRHLSPFDSFIAGFDQTLRHIGGVNRIAQRPTPGSESDPSGNDASETSAVDQSLSEAERLLSGRLMRVNHAGEIAAQALYRGQALAASSAHVRQSMLKAAQEETDHLAWCEERLGQLRIKTSLLNPLWYAGSFAIGYVAGKAGDDWSLGFVGETERQVEQHLAGHRDRLPNADQSSRQILAAMQADEARHGKTAMDAGGRVLPAWIRGLMRGTSRIMTRSSFWI